MKKLIAALLTASLLAASAVGCSGGGTDQSSGTNQSTGMKSDSDNQTKLTAMFNVGSGDEVTADIYKSITDKFNKENKFNAEVQIQTYENEQYKTKLTTLMAANSQPDVFFTYEGGFLKPFVDGGKVYEIGQDLNKDSEWKSRFNASVLGPLTYDDKIYAVPSCQSVAVVFYNKAIFKENGIQVPATYAEFLQDCNKLSAAGVVPMALSGKDAWIPGELLQQVDNAVGGMDLHDQTVAKTKNWDDPLYLEGAKQFAKMLDNHAFASGFLGMTQDEAKHLFMDGKAAMYYMGSWDLAVLTGDNCKVKSDVGIFALPPEKPENKNVLVGSVDQSFAVSSKSNNIQASVAYVKMFSDPEFQKQYAYNAKYLISTNVQLDSSKLDPRFVEITNLLRESKGLTPWFDRTFSAGEGTEFNNAAQAIVGGKDPEQQMKNLQKFSVDNSLR